MTTELRATLEQQALQDRLVERNLAVPGNRVLLTGLPGTGKSTMAKKVHASLFSDGIFVDNITSGKSAALGQGFFVPKPDEKTGSPTIEFMLGVWSKAMGLVIDADGNKVWEAEKTRLVLNEIHSASDDVEMGLHIVLDTHDVAEQALPNGWTVFKQPACQCVATGNEPVEALETALADRFDAVLQVDLPSEEAVESLPGDLQEFCLKVALLPGNQRISFRDIKSFANFRDLHNFDPIMAATSVWDSKRGRGAGEEIVNSYNLAGAAVV